MKKITFTVLLATLVIFGVSAQTGESVTTSKTPDFVFASQTVATEQHSSLMDKLQKETEELIMTVTPAPLITLASLIDRKLDVVHERKATKNRNQNKKHVTNEL